MACRWQPHCRSARCNAKGGRTMRGRHFLLGLALAGVALFLYYSKTQVNPVTGEKQHISMSVDQEKALGLQSAPEMAAKMGGEVDTSDPDAARVKAVGRRIVERSNAGRSPYADSFQYHLLRDPETVNAFALPGGQVFITEGLLR